MKKFHILGIAHCLALIGLSFLVGCAKSTPRNSQSQSIVKAYPDVIRWYNIEIPTAFRQYFQSSNDIDKELEPIIRSGYIWYGKKEILTGSLDRDIVLLKEWFGQETKIVDSGKFTPKSESIAESAVPKDVYSKELLIPIPDRNSSSFVSANTTFLRSKDSILAIPRAYIINADDKNKYKFFDITSQDTSLYVLPKQGGTFALMYLSPLSDPSVKPSATIVSVEFSDDPKSPWR